MDAKTKDTIAWWVTGLHKAIFDLTNGWLLGNVAGMPVLKLTTTGRKSGQPRDTMLTAPIRNDDEVVIVASWGGDDRHPQWFRNLEAKPEVEATFAGKRRRMQARIVSPEEKAEMWPRIVEAYSGYAGYQKATDRDIPVVVLSPS